MNEKHCSQSRDGSRAAVTGDPLPSGMQSVRQDDKYGPVGHRAGKEPVWCGMFG
jgi:hypothetical protein